MKLITTLLSVISQDVFAPNATSNRYLDISLIRYEYLYPISCSIMILKKSAFTSHLYGIWDIRNHVSAILDSESIVNSPPRNKLTSTKSFFAVFRANSHNCSFVSWLITLSRKISANNVV